MPNRRSRPYRLALALLSLSAVSAAPTSTTGAIAASASPSAKTVTPLSFTSKPFDVIIVGGGTAGLVLASRLTESVVNCSAESLRVGVIEAGQDRPSDPLIDVPSAGNLLGNADIGTLLGNPKYDWMLESVPQQGLNGEVIQYPRGKVLGGSSAINSMVWQRGSRPEYDAWGTAFGNGPNWTFDALVPYFNRVERWSAPVEDSNALLPEDTTQVTALATSHGRDGPIAVSYNNWLSDLERPLVESAANLGITPNPNPDAGNSAGFPTAGTARCVDPVTGKRSYAASAYYGQYVRERENLVVLTGAVVTKMLWEKGKEGKKPRAMGVEFSAGNKTYTVEAKKEVILSAGSLKTPQILELSGVGNKTLLHGLGISVTLDLPQIGENLNDHPVALSDFKVKDGVITLDQLGFNKTFATEQATLYNTTHTGAFTYTSADLGPLPLRSITTPSQFEDMRKELDLSLSRIPLTPLQRAQYKVLKNLVDGGKAGWVELVLVPSGGVISVPESGKAYFTAVAVQLHPFSRGSVHINSTDPFASPVIDPKFLRLPWDVDVLLRGSQFVRKWAGAGPMRDILDEFVTPPLNVTTDQQWVKFMKSVVRTTNHPLGTTAMAPRSLGGVVDTRLKVHGLANVRIVDAGIIPLTIGVAIQPTVYAIAEKAADIFKEDWNLL
ncbi:hypothetical protein EW146_g8451 [Bondarzewia mesenterica]|uniref:Glucose-methanol-choline oxidoreductase N-terminal domain-containing protein n=1 Tax=Bondarzewia mesenterica TaxID=1095465 RepID=A0A4S4LEV2_9AGAM|nr:hypothetical protein EW146_g8451 [Bondarzewia mesenterica]